MLTQKTPEQIAMVEAADKWLKRAGTLTKAVKEFLNATLSANDICVMMKDYRKG